MSPHVTPPNTGLLLSYPGGQVIQQPQVSWPHPAHSCLILTVPFPAGSLHSGAERSNAGSLPSSYGASQGQPVSAASWSLLSDLPPSSSALIHRWSCSCWRLLGSERVQLLTCLSSESPSLVPTLLNHDHSMLINS